MWFRLICPHTYAAIYRIMLYGTWRYILVCRYTKHSDLVLSGNLGVRSVTVIYLRLQTLEISSNRNQVQVDDVTEKGSGIVTQFTRESDASHVE